MKFSALIAAVFTFAAGLCLANILPLGCYPWGTGGYYEVDTTTSMEDCAAVCTGRNALYAKRYTYTFWNDEEEHSDFGIRCACSNGLGYTPSDWTYNQYCSQADVYDPPVSTIWLLQTTFNRLGCGYINDYYERVFTSQPDFEACFSQCKESTYAIVDRALGGGGQDIGCSCTDDSEVFYTPGSCEGTNLQDYNWMIFQHPAGSSGSPSAWVKRQLRERLEREQGQLALAVCPTGLTACKTFKGDDTSFECIEPQTELESCGGCLYGEFGGSSNSSNVGDDCLSLSGVTQEGVTCLQGECLAFSCEEGYDLQENECVKLA